MNKFFNQRNLSFLRTGVLILSVLFTAQACNFFFGDLTGEQGSGPRGVFVSTDSGQSWQEAGKVSNDRNLSNAQISQVFIERGRPNNVLAASLNSGLYASEDRGQLWFPLLPNFSAHTAFINPNNSEEIFVAGTRNRLAAILKSPDRGSSWVQLFNEPNGQAAVTSMIFDSRNAAIFYAGLSTGTILRSTDFGVTWNALTNVQDRVVELLLSPDNRYLYALGRTKGLKRSENGGNSWTDLEIPDQPASFHDILIDPGNSAVLYLSTDKGLFRSFDSGSTWSRVILPATLEVSNVTAVGVNPLNSRQIFAGIRSTFYRSDDSGQTWSVIALPTVRKISSIVIDPLEPNRIYIGLE